jgi:hypothetical protein
MQEPNLRMASCLLHLWVFAPFWNAKTTIYGLLWSLQGKKVPKRHFFEILRAKRNKLLDFILAQHNLSDKQKLILHI